MNQCIQCFCLSSTSTKVLHAAWITYFWTYYGEEETYYIWVYVIDVRSAFSVYLWWCWQSVKSLVQWAKSYRYWQGSSTEPNIHIVTDKVADYPRDGWKKLGVNDKCGFVLSICHIKKVSVLTCDSVDHHHKLIFAISRFYSSIQVSH